MRLLSQNPRTGEIKVLVTNPDDLWHLSNIIRPGDRVKGYTFRREEAREDAVRAQREPKVRLFLTVVVDRVEFMDFQNVLRVTGRIVDAEFGTGSFHTFNIEEGSDIIIEKEEWHRHDLERIREAVEGKGSSRFICISIEHGEATIAVVKSFGVDEIAVIHGRESKEEGTSAVRDNLYMETIKQVRALPKMPVLVAGPGFIKEDFLRKAREVEPSLFSDAQVIQTGQGGMAGIREALSKPENSRLLQDARMSEEVKAVNEIMEGISRNGPVVYGVEGVRKALEAGAVKKLVLTDRLLRDREIESMMRTAEEKAGEIFIVTSRWESGKQLDGLGGIAAVLRYRTWQ